MPFLVLSWFKVAFVFIGWFTVSFMFCRPVHGLIFLFKWKDDDDMEGSIVQDSRLGSIFFAKQVNIFQHVFKYISNIMLISR